MSANAIQVAALAVRLRILPRQVRVILEMVQAVRTMPTQYVANDDEKMRACDIVIATGRVESNWTIYANGNNGASLRFYHEAVGWDHGSVGVLQQQVGGAPNSTADWGTTAQCMDPTYNAKKFVQVLTTKHNYFGVGWKKLSNGTAAQMVQGSAFPDRYAGADAEAIKIRKAVWGYCAPGKSVVKTPTAVKAPPVKARPGTNGNHGKIVVVDAKVNSNLSIIAKRNGVSLAALLKENPKAGHPAGNENNVWPGDKIRIP
jgi:LysM repeat protein